MANGIGYLNIHSNRIEIGKFVIPIEESFGLQFLDTNRLRLFCHKAFGNTGRVIIDFNLLTAEKTKRFTLEMLKHSSATLKTRGKLKTSIERNTEGTSLGSIELTLESRDPPQLFGDCLSPACFEGYDITYGDRTIKLEKIADPTELTVEIHNGLNALDRLTGGMMTLDLENQPFPTFCGQFGDEPTNPSPADPVYLVTYDQISKNGAKILSDFYEFVPLPPTILNQYLRREFAEIRESSNTLASL
jgi:hypothetical protein